MFLLLPLVFLVAAIALPLAKRDVVDPPILVPNNATVWYVGQKQTVTWNATGLPTSQTNPLGTLVLGYWYNNSENLMLNSPLATNISYSAGQVEITVPNVPGRSDYIVVLFGDSGNASPEFNIINNSSTSVPPSSASTESESFSSSPGSSPPAASTPPSTPSPAGPNTPGSPGGGSSPTPVSAFTGSQAAGALPTPTALSSSVTVTSRSSTVVTVAASATAKSNAAGQRRASSLAVFLGVALTALYFTFS